ncbi:hypothetical protein J7L68_02765, partial [bacterium]|nr:hypothetical protein [bacterium]
LINQITFHQLKRTAGSTRSGVFIALLSSRQSRDSLQCLINQITFHQLKRTAGSSERFKYFLTNLVR